MYIPEQKTDKWIEDDRVLRSTEGIPKPSDGRKSLSSLFRRKRWHLN